MALSTSGRPTSTQIVYFIIALIVVVALVRIVDSGDRHDRLSDAGHELSDGVTNAARDLNPHRTTGDKIGDAVEDAGKSIRDKSQ